MRSAALRGGVRAQAIGRISAAPIVLATALTAVLCGYAITQIPAQTLVSAESLLLLALLTGGSLATLVVAIRANQLLAPLGLIAVTALVYFVARPLELALYARPLTHQSYNYYATPLEQVQTISGQEISLYVHSHMSGTFDAAFTRALLVVTLFFACILVGYRLRVSRLLAARAARIGSTMGILDLRWIVVAWLGVGLIGQSLILAKIGGITTAFTQLGTQGNLGVEFTYLVILNFFTVGVVLWICWLTPRDRRGRILLGAAIGELVAFYALLGSRTLVLVPILLALLAWSEIRKPWRLRTLATGAILAVLFASGYLSLREESRDASFAQALGHLPEHAVDVRTILNASPVFDELFMATDTIPTASPYRYGGEIVQGAVGQLPRFIYPGKPEANDLSFRKLIWGDRFLAGRPIGAAGEFYRDFGLPGVVLGALLFGMLARALTGLRAGVGESEGRELRVAIYVLAVVLLSQFLVGSYSIVFGQALAMGIPLLLALRVFARPA